MLTIGTIFKIIEQHKDILPNDYEIEVNADMRKGQYEVMVVYKNFWIREFFGPADDPLTISKFINKAASYIENMYKSASM